MVMWSASQSWPYAENLSPLDPASNDILAKMSVNFAEGKVPQENKKIQNW